MAAGLDGMECNSTIEIGRSRQKLQQQKMIKERQQRVHKLLAGLKCVTVMINIIILMIWESYYSKNTLFPASPYRAILLGHVHCFLSRRSIGQII